MKRSAIAARLDVVDTPRQAAPRRFRLLTEEIGTEAPTALAAFRARQWWYFAALPIVSADWRATQYSHAALVRLALAVGAAALCLAYAYGINAVEDRAADRNVVKNPLAGTSRVPHLVLVLLALSGVLAIALGAALGTTSVVAVAVSLTGGTVYSAGPRCKALPVLGTAVNALIFVPLLFVGQANPALLPAQELFCITFLALLTQNQLLHELADRDEDAAAGARTTALTLGESTTAAIALLVGLAGALAIALRHPTRAGSLAATGVFAGGILARAARAGRAASTRVAHRWLSIGTGTVTFAAAWLERAPW